MYIETIVKPKLFNNKKAILNQKYSITNKEQYLNHKLCNKKNKNRQYPKNHLTLKNKGYCLYLIKSF